MTKLVNELKVIQIIDSLNPGGAEMMAVNIANGLNKIGVNSHLCVTRKEGDLKNSIVKGVGYLFLNKKRSLDLKAILKLNSYAKSHQINTIHAHSSSFFIAVQLKLINPFLNVVWHDHYGSSESLTNRKSVALKVCSYFFNSTIAVNKLLFDWSLKKLNTKNRFYLPNFATLNNRIKIETVLKGTNGKRIICLANLRPQKDHLNLLKAIKLIENDLNNWTLHLVGLDLYDEYSDKIKSFIKEEGLENAVFLYGSRLDIYHILEQTTIGVLSSKSEGLPVSLLEYGLASLPVVVTNVGDCSQVIEHMKSGMMVHSKNEKELADGLMYLIENELNRSTFGKIFFNKIKTEFSEESFLKKLIKIYQFD
ncbi:glycosyltransferase [Lutibacter flavus]|uniref:Glycosyltransferase involved in cell wall bisynthesis n=1 Tax=Lutibacter flavus TaxID=691689 RepID=A0A238VQK8_9FLAO|nr:glycosyltransferase [Lutibacter flavus]SNR36471.1 Glycosyltransferase involved in cell wall bisynthesis [Lutibacter flavus]